MMPVGAMRPVPVAMMRSRMMTVAVVMAIAVPVVTVLHFAHVRHDVALHAGGDARGRDRCGLRAIAGRRDHQQTRDGGETRKFQKVHDQVPWLEIRFVSDADLLVALRRATPLVIKLTRVT